MDISAFLVSQQTDPQSRALAANALTPGMGGRGEEQQYDAAQGQQQQDPLAPDGAIPMPATTGGLDQAALNQGSTPQPPPDDHADVQQGFEDGGPVREFGELSENIEDRRDGKELNMRLGTHTPEYQEKTGQARDLAAVSGLGRSGMEGDGRVMKFDEGGDVQSRRQRPEDDSPIDSSYRRVGDVDDLKQKSWQDRGRARYDQKVRTKPFGDDLMGGAQDYYHRQSGGHTTEFDEGGAIPDMPGAEPPEDNAAMESDPRIALKAALDYGYNHHAVNRPIPDETHGPDVQAMMHGAGATSHQQAEQAIKMFNGDSAKAIGAVYDFYNKQGDTGPEEAPAAPKHWGSQATGEHGPMAFAKKAWDTISAPPEGPSPVQAAAEEFGEGENTKAGSGAAAAWAVLQQIRKGVGSLFAGARAANDHGNAPKAAELLKGALDRLPDGTTANVTPGPDGTYGVTTSTGWKGNLGPDEFGNIVTMPFDKIVNMGVDHALQSVVPASINMEQARAVRARMTRQDEEQGLSPDGSGAPAQQPTPPHDPNVPGPNEPITIVRGPGITGGGKHQVVVGHHKDGTPMMQEQYYPAYRQEGYTQQVNRETGQNIPVTSEHERVAAITAKGHTDAAEIAGRWRVTAQNVGGGMAKTDFVGAVQRAINQHWSTHPIPTGPDADAVISRKNKELENDIAQRGERFQQQFGGQRAPGVARQGAAPAQTQVKDGVTYEKVNGGWQAQ